MQGPCLSSFNILEETLSLSGWNPWLSLWSTAGFWEACPQREGGKDLHSVSPGA